MNVSHVAGGGVGALLGALAAALLRRYANLDLSEADAALVGSAALTAGVGLGHALGEYGLLGIGRILLRGKSA